MNTQTNTIDTFRTAQFSFSSTRKSAAGFLLALVTTAAMLQGAHTLATHTEADQNALMSRAVVTSSQA
jgi:hypothetical protein